MDELDDRLAHLNDLDVAWGLDPDAFMQERAQQAPATGEAGSETPETTRSSQGGAADASSTPIRRTESNPGSASASAPAKGTVRIPPWSCRVGQDSSSAAGDGSLQQSGIGPGVRANVWRMNPQCTWEG